MSVQHTTIGNAKPYSVLRTKLNRRGVETLIGHDLSGTYLSVSVNKPGAVVRVWSPGNGAAEDLWTIEHSPTAARYTESAAARCTQSVYYPMGLPPMLLVRVILAFKTIYDEAHTFGK